ncbi:Uncharacterised protein [Chlamydia abortus]|nr:Uncharacterised protein [Chlamydia abortus]
MVVFPEPLLPTKRVIWPSSKENETLDKICLSFMEYVRFLTLTVILPPSSQATWLHKKTMMSSANIGLRKYYTFPWD